jgi:phosphate transport system substrate-binding protein
LASAVRGARRNPLLPDPVRPLRLSGKQRRIGSFFRQSAPSDSAKTGNISIAGSTALQPLLTQAVHSFKSETEFIGAITVNGGGSGQGLLDVAAGAVDIGSSDISPAQAGQEETCLVDHQVAVVLVAVAVSPDVAANLTEISTADLKGIFTGAITDWTEVAGWKGASLPIAVYYHRGGSGTRVIFETYGIMTPLGNEYLSALSGFTEIQSAVNLEKALNVDKGAIGYAAYPYCSGLSVLKIDGVEPNYENVYSGKYKLWACGHLYTKGEPSGAGKSFIEFLQASDFEQTITENGYGLISEMTVRR